MYTQDDVDRLSGSVHIEYTLEKLGAEKLRKKITSQKNKGIPILVN